MINLIVKFLPFIFRKNSGGTLAFVNIRVAAYFVIILVALLWYGKYKISSTWNNWQESKQIAQEVKTERGAAQIRNDSLKLQQSRESVDTQRKKLIEENEENTIHRSLIR